jgi:hypothetical protein
VAIGTKIIKLEKMKYLKLLYQFPMYILYVLMTMEQRNNYLVGQSKGMHVENSYDDGFIIKSSATVYQFNPNKKPEKEYATWKEFWMQRGWYT